MDKELKFLLYSTPNEDVNVNVVVKDENLWLTQKAMAELFDVGEKREATVEEIMQDTESVTLITSMCGHYTLENKEVKDALAVLKSNMTELGIDSDFYVIKKIKDSIDRYIYCFGLYGTTTALIQEAK